MHPNPTNFVRYGTSGQTALSLKKCGLTTRSISHKVCGIWTHLYVIGKIALDWLCVQIRAFDWLTEMHTNYGNVSQKRSVYCNAVVPLYMYSGNLYVVWNFSQRGSVNFWQVSQLYPCVWSLKIIKFSNKKPSRV